MGREAKAVPNMDNFTLPPEDGENHEHIAAVNKEWILSLLFNENLPYVAINLDNLKK